MHWPLLWRINTTRLKQYYKMCDITFLYRKPFCRLFLRICLMWSLYIHHEQRRRGGGIHRLFRRFAVSHEVRVSQALCVFVRSIPGALTLKHTRIHLLVQFCQMTIHHSVCPADKQLTNYSGIDLSSHAHIRLVDHVLYWARLPAIMPPAACRELISLYKNFTRSHCYSGNAI